jgi:hypothetical protein
MKASKITVLIACQIYSDMQEHHGVGITESHFAILSSGDVIVFP